MSPQFLLNCCQATWHMVMMPHWRHSSLGLELFLVGIGTELLFAFDPKLPVRAPFSPSDFRLNATFHYYFVVLRWWIIFFNFRWSLLQIFAVVWLLWTSPWLAVVCRVSVWIKCWKLRDLTWIKRDLTFLNFKVSPCLFSVFSLHFAQFVPIYH